MSTPGRTYIREHPLPPDCPTPFSSRAARSVLGGGVGWLIVMVLLGLTSPVGLFQGAFRVIEENGRNMVINGNNNVGLFKELSAEEMELGLSSSLTQGETGLMNVKKGPLNFNNFISLVKKLVNSKK